MKKQIRWLMPQNWFRKKPPSKIIEHFIHLKGVGKVYKTAGGSFTALKGVDLEIDAGEFVAIVGKSGSGKSTLLNMITGIDHPTSGEVWLNGVAIHKYNEDRLTLWRGKNVGIVFQFFQLIPTLTVLENVLMPMDFTGKYPFFERHRRAVQLLEMVDMLEFKHKLPSTLSGGQQQRCAIARALANDPPILVADEPTGNLDSATAEVIFQLFEDLARKGKTVIIVTHDIDLAQRCLRYIRLADGMIVEISPSIAEVEPPGEMESIVVSERTEMLDLAKEDYKN